MINKKYPIIIFGIIGAYHIGVHFINSEYETNRELKRKQAEEERQQRIKNI